MRGLTVGFAMCGSFCTFEKAVKEIVNIKNSGANVIPIMSYNAFSTDTRFGKSADFINKIENICGNKIISTLFDAEPIGPKKILDILIIEPCTGNTLAKLANGITDTPVTLAAKAHLRNERPLVIAVSTNDALSCAAKNIGSLMNYKNIYFVPMKQDDSINKPRSVVADFTKTVETLKSAAENKQIQPIYI